MNWDKEIKTSYLIAAGAALVLVAILTAWVAAGVKVSPDSGDVSVHVRKVAPTQRNK